MKKWVAALLLLTLTGAHLRAQPRKYKPVPRQEKLDDLKNPFDTTKKVKAVPVKTKTAKKPVPQKAILDSVLPVKNPAVVPKVHQLPKP